MTPWAAWCGPVICREADSMRLTAHEQERLMVHVAADVTVLALSGRGVLASAVAPDASDLRRRLDAAQALAADP